MRARHGAGPEPDNGGSGAQGRGGSERGQRPRSPAAVQPERATGLRVTPPFAVAWGSGTCEGGTTPAGSRQRLFTGSGTVLSLPSAADWSPAVLRSGEEALTAGESHADTTRKTGRSSGPRYGTKAQYGRTMQGL